MALIWVFPAYPVFQLSRIITSLFLIQMWRGSDHLASNLLISYSMGIWKLPSKTQETPGNFPPNCPSFSCQILWFSFKIWIPIKICQPLTSENTTEFSLANFPQSARLVKFSQAEWGPSRYGHVGGYLIKSREDSKITGTRKGSSFLREKSRSCRL